jgi:hypothetical protein
MAWPLLCVLRGGCKHRALIRWRANCNSNHYLAGLLRCWVQRQESRGAGGGGGGGGPLSARGEKAHNPELSGGLLPFHLPLTVHAGKPFERTLVCCSLVAIYRICSGGHWIAVVGLQPHHTPEHALKRLLCPPRCRLQRVTAPAKVLQKYREGRARRTLPRRTACSHQ